MGRILNTLPFVLGAAMTPVAGSAQQPTMRVDTLVRIVAIVGDSAITNGELTRSLDLWASRAQQSLPPAGPALDSLVDQVLSERIDALLLIQAAESDTSITVTEEEIRVGVDNQIASIRSQYPSPGAFEQALTASNLTMQEYRSMLSAQLRERRLIDTYVARQLRDRKPPPISDDAVRTFFSAQVEEGGTPPMLPPSITFEQIVLPVAPSDTALTRVKAKADSVVALIRDDGQDFATVARRFSEDAASAELGGDLGWFRPGAMTLDFELAVYSPLLRPGDVTDPVLTSFGYHIIKLERVRGPERQARHILFRQTLYDQDRERARVLADSIAKLVRAGAPMDSLRRLHGDRDEQARLGPVVRDSMPGEYVSAFANVMAGDIVGPFGYTAAGPRWVIAKVDLVEPERRATVEDYREQIQEQMGRDRLVEEMLAELRRQTFIEIRSRAARPRS